MTNHAQDRHESVTTAGVDVGRAAHRRGVPTLTCVADGNVGSTAAGEINCGENVCGSGEKCCISVPGLAVCVPESQSCTCVTTEPDDAGTEDAGH